MNVYGDGLGDGLGEGVGDGLGDGPGDMFMDGIVIGGEINLEGLGDGVGDSDGIVIDGIVNGLGEAFWDGLGFIDGIIIFFSIVVVGLGEELREGILIEGYGDLVEELGEGIDGLGWETLILGTLKSLDGSFIANALLTDPILDTPPLLRIGIVGLGGLNVNSCLTTISSIIGIASFS